MKHPPVITILLLCTTIICRAQSSFTVYFDLDRSRLTAAAAKQLDSFLVHEKENLAAYSIGLNGYCDPSGTDMYNARLSEQRVAAVKQYLLRQGVLPENIGEARGHGERRQLNDNRTHAERQLNRRVEISFSKNIAGDPERSLMETIADTATKKGTTIVLRNINFYGGTPLPLPASFDVMDELLETMKVNYNLIIEIRGHICCIDGPGDSEYRETGNGLSEERARTIYAYLTGNGIAESRVTYKGYGHSLPIYPYPERSEEERIANRRVEIRIINK